MSNLTCAMIQTSIDWLSPESNLARLEEMLKPLRGSDLYILPETFATGFAFDQAGIGESEEGPILEWMRSMASQLNGVITGSVAINHQTQYANRLYWVYPNGKVEHYDKRHLFRMGNEHHHVIAGNNRKIFNLKGFRILPQICYDLRFPVWARNRNDYDVMLNIANWPAARRKPYDILLQARAIENQCYVLAVNRIGTDGKGTDHSGGTAIYDFKGDTVDIVEDNSTGVIIQTLSLVALNQFREQFPAYRDADDFSLHY